MSNLGLYHPIHNPEGSKKAIDDLFWYNTSTSFVSKADCFDPTKILANSGTIASGVSGRPDGKYADVIYESSVKDLRMSSRKVPLREVREKYRAMAVDGTVRGFENIPYQVDSSTVSDSNSYKQSKSTHTSIFSTNSVFDTTFPSGIEGYLSTVKPDGVTDSFPLNKKALQLHGAERSTDNGNTWSIFTPTLDTVANSITLTNEPTSNIVLVHYEAQASFAEDAAGVEQLTEWSPVYATNSNDESLLVSSLTGGVPTGTDPSEELSITKIIDGTISHTAETLMPTVKYSISIGVNGGRAYLLYNYDSGGVIDSSNIKATALPYFIT